MTPSTMARLTAGLLLYLVCLLAAGPAKAQETDTVSTAPSPVRDVAEFPFDQEHLRLAVRLDPEAGRVVGDALLRLRTTDHDVRHILLHAAGLQIDSVLVGPTQGPLAPAAHEMRSAELIRVGLSNLADHFADGVVPADQSFVVRVYYTARPRRGLYFAGGPEPGEVRVWTHGRPEENRYWFPAHDFAGDALTSELHVTVDRPLRVLASGVPSGEAEGPDGRVTYSFEQRQPHPVHAVTLVAGPLHTIVERILLADGRSVPLTYSVAPDRVGDAARTFGRTPEIVRFLSDRLGYLYPGERYDQVALEGAVCGGVVGPGIALFTDDLLVGEKAAVDFDPAPALVEALARQWFGQLVTPGQWSDSWLEDGLAAYLAAHFIERDRGEDAFHLHLEALAERYFAFAEADDAPPLVWDGWQDPARLFSGYTAARGAWILHQLRSRMGDASFWNVVDVYLSSHRHRTVSTQDFRHAVEASTDARVQTFFDQWVYGAGHPVVAASYRYDGAEGTLHLTLRQTQEGRGVAPVFPLAFAIDVQTLGGAERFQVAMTEREQRYAFALASPPRFVVPDPERTLLARFEVDQPTTAWVAQLRYGADVVSRLRAARTLAAYHEDPALLIALRNAFEQERDPAVRAAILETVSRLPRTGATERLLVGAYEDPDPRVRAAALDALGGFEGSAEAAAVAVRAAQRDASARVQAAAVHTLARIGAGEAPAIVRSALVTPSHRDVIRRRALEALPHVGLPPSDVLAEALRYSDAGHSVHTRTAAAGLLARLAPDQRAALNRLVELLGDEDAPVRRAAADALAALDLDAARQALTAWRATAPADPACPAPVVTF